MFNDLYLQSGASLNAMDLSTVAFPVNTPKFWGNEKDTAKLRWYLFVGCAGLISCDFAGGASGRLH